MVRLIVPEERYLDSYREACEEQCLHGETEYTFTNPEKQDVFQKFHDYRTGRNLKPNRVEAEYFWLVDESRTCFIGEVCIRRRLTEALMRYGGHIGYGVRRSERRKGYGTLMLRLAMEKAEEIGLKEVMITCDEGNAASARVAEKNGMRFLDRIENETGGVTVTTRRYWTRLK